jgi:hypothetical protein
VNPSEISARGERHEVEREEREDEEEPTDERRKGERNV